MSKQLLYFLIIMQLFAGGTSQVESWNKTEIEPTELILDGYRALVNLQKRSIENSRVKFYGSRQIPSDNVKVHTFGLEIIPRDSIYLIYRSLLI